ncbi:MAG: hypothetical protein LBT74_10865 [Acidobacteriota bacterium]|jgi:hypothetical protein|nr:hypothetical protein [Acidobacteriota bacterium]
MVSRRFLPLVATLFLVLAPLAAPLGAQTAKPDLPDPIKFLNTYNQVLNMTRAVMEDMGLKIEREDRVAGRITTRPYEFITGSLTADELAKVAIRKDTLTGDWLKARYTTEAIVEIVSPKETMVTVQADIEALNRDVDGTEKWVALESLGTVERRVLGRISVKLLGTDAPAEPRKGFWGQKPQPVDPRQPRFPGTVK